MVRTKFQECLKQKLIGENTEILIEFIFKIIDMYNKCYSSYKELQKLNKKSINQFVKIEISFLFEKGINQKEIINALKIAKPYFDKVYDTDRKEFNCIFFNQLIEEIFEMYNILVKNSSNYRLGLLLQNMLHGIIILEPVNEGKDFRIKEYNKVATKLLCFNWKFFDIERRLSNILLKENRLYIISNISLAWKKSESQDFICKNYSEGSLINYIKYYVFPVQTGEIVLIINDLTECKKNEEKLRKSEEKYKALFHYANDMIFINDAKEQSLGSFLEVNETACCKLGYEREELLSSKPEEISCLNPEYFNGNKSIFEVFKREGCITYENYISNKNGEKIPVELNSHLFRLMGREVIISVARDITERKKNEQELKEKEERYRKLVELSPSGIVVVSEGKIIFINQAALVMIKEENSEKIIGKKVFNYIHPDYLPVAKERITRALESKKPNPLQIVKYLRKNGDVFYSETQSTYLRYSEKDAILVVFRDISDRLVEQRKLRESEERYRQLVELSPDYIIVHKENKIVFANNNSLKKLGATSLENLLEKDILDIIHTLYREDAKKRIKDVLDNGNTYNMIEIKYLDFNGNEIDIEESLSPFNYKGEKAVLVVAHDISERKKTEAELEIARKNIQEKEKLALIGQMSAGMAHEIRNPLTAVRGFTQLIKMKYAEDIELQSYVDLIIKEIDQINEVLSDFLQLAKPREPLLRKYSLAQVLKEAIAIVLPHALLHNITIQYVPNDEDIFCFLDKSQIKQVLLNMFRNSIEAINEKGIIKVETVNIPENKEVIIKITDDGCGISLERQKILGMPFYSTKETGTGLGLSVSYSIIKAHKGRVEVASEKGRGTTFCIFLPCLSELS